MDVLKLATDWATAEATTASFFIVFGLLFIASSIGLWKWGKTKLARAYIFPTLIAGILLTVLGSALFEMYYSLIEGLTQKYLADTFAFVENEILRTNGAIISYKSDLFNVFPFVIAGTSILLMVIKREILRAIFITIIAMSAIILLVDSNAISLLEHYNTSLQQLK